MCWAKPSVSQGSIKDPTWHTSRPGGCGLGGRQRDSWSSQRTSSFFCKTTHGKLSQPVSQSCSHQCGIILDGILGVWSRVSDQQYDSGLCLAGADEERDGGRRAKECGARHLFRVQFQFLQFCGPCHHTISVYKRQASFRHWPFYWLRQIWLLNLALSSQSFCPGNL